MPHRGIHNIQFFSSECLKSVVLATSMTLIMTSFQLITALGKQMWAMWFLDSNLWVKRSPGWVDGLCHGSHMVNRKLIPDPHKFLRSELHTLSICYGKMLEVTGETKLCMLFPIFSDNIKLLLVIFLFFYLFFPLWYCNLKQ